MLKGSFVRREETSVVDRLERRLGRLHARQRLGIEADHEAQIFGQGLNFFHIENWYSIHSLIRAAFRLTGLYRRGLKNAADVQVRKTDLAFGSLPKAFEGFTLLHISDLHVDMNNGAMQRLMQLVPSLEYDICVLTGDFRGATFGPFETAIEGIARMCALLKSPVYGVLGNHDTIQMVPALEDLGIRMLLNECVSLWRANEQIYLVGIDDAHFYRVDNIEKAASTIPPASFTILLSHTPEVYRHAAHAGFDLLLSGHTHGGQIYLPRSVPITLDSVLPRRFGSGLWRYHEMIGYTSVGVGSSVVPIRLNCLPEITLHRLHSAVLQ
jgi:predicted MPP superfamily phosphohydrolase